MATSNHGTFDVTKVDTTAYTPLLGTEIVVTDATQGDRVWIYCKNTTGGALAVGNIVMQKNASLTRGEISLADDAGFGSCLVLGVVQAVVASSSTSGFWAVRKGMCEVLVESAGGTSSVNTGLNISTTAGKALTATAITHDGFGYTIDNIAAASGVITCYVDCRG